jgi:hypothetical protein
MDEMPRQEAAATAEIARKANDREQELIEFLKSRAVAREAQIDGVRAKARHLLAKQEERRRRCIEDCQTLVEQDRLAQMEANRRKRTHAEQSTHSSSRWRLPSGD